MTAVVRLAQLRLITQDLARLADFYVRAFHCTGQVSEHLAADATARLIGLRVGARRARLALGAQQIDLLQLDAPGRPYPRDVAASDLRFQHFAIVVSDMARAYQHLLHAGGWVNISLAGPQRLPASSGGVTAFKFRDPDGHPLELLCFPSGPADEARPPRPARLFVGIDHSAICVSDSARSIAFYEQLGLTVGAHQINQGVEQQQLDGLEGARVQVVALRPRHAPPHLELLCYQELAQRSSLTLQPDDVAATRLVFECGESAAPPRHLLDPDGHYLVVC